MQKGLKNKPDNVIETVETLEEVSKLYYSKIKKLSNLYIMQDEL
ncbi:hypothetical protein ACI2JA_03425 [Alkalihalobacillus sp. NPDC078783]